MRWTQAQRWRSAAAAAVVGVALVALGAAPARGAGAADEQPVVRVAAIEPASGVTAGGAVAPTPTRVYMATLSPRGLPMLAALREAAAVSGAGGDAQKNRTRERAPQPPAGGVWHEEVTLEPIWSAEDTSAESGAMVPVAIAVGRCAVVMVSRSAGGAGQAIVTSFAKADGSLNWSRPTTGVAATGGTTLSAFEPVGAAVVPLKGIVPAGDCGEGMIAQGVLVGGTGTISGGARVPVVLGWSLQADPPLAVPIPGSPLLSQAVAGFRDEVTVAKPLLSGQEGRPSAAVLGLGLAGTRVEIPGGTSDWFVRVAHVTNTQPPLLTWRWLEPAIVNFDTYDVPTDLCMGGWLAGDHNFTCGTQVQDKPHFDTIYVVGTSRSTPNGPRTARLRTFKAQSGVPPLPTEQFLNGSFRHTDSGVPQDVNALSIAYSANVDDDGSYTQGCDKRGVFVTGSIGPVGGPTRTIVMSWAGPLNHHVVVQPPQFPPEHWPRWAAVPPASIQGAGRVSDGGLVVVAPAPPEPSASSVSPRTVLHTIGSWTDTQGTTHWRLMRWRPERPQP